MTRVLMVDDHRLFIQGMRALLETESDIQIVGECYSGLDVLAAVEQLTPDVVLMDINMPGMNGVEAARQILLGHPGTGIIMLTMYDDDAQVFHALKNGARGYVLKDAEISEVVRAIRAVARGESIIDSMLVTRVLTEFKRLSQQATTPSGDTLSPREVEILRAIVAGLSNKEIGARLNFSEKTIKNYITVIFQKLNISSRAQAAAYTVQHKLLEDS
jgi:NarL family two-component system response regulator LiaR